MQSRHVWTYASRMLAIGATTSLLITAAWAASATKLVYSFGGNADGEYTDTELVRDSAGNLYGTSVQGGVFGGGTVFQVSPQACIPCSMTSLAARTAANLQRRNARRAGKSVWNGGYRRRRIVRGWLWRGLQLSNSGGTWTQTVIHTFTAATARDPGARWRSIRTAMFLERPRPVGLTGSASSTRLPRGGGSLEVPRDPYLHRRRRRGWRVGQQALD